MQRQVYISPEKMVIEKLEKYPATNLDPNFDQSRFLEIETEFKSLDIDQSGWLSLAEIELHLKRKGCDQQLIQEIFNELNTNQDQKISKDEFTHGYLNKESNLKEEIKQHEIKIKKFRIQEEDIKSKFTQTNCSQLILTLQSGCLSSFYHSQDDVIKAAKQIEAIIQCNEAQDGIDRLSKPSLNCEFPVWGDVFNYSLQQDVIQITFSIEIFEIHKLEKQSLGKIVIQKDLNSEFDKSEKIIFENIGEIILQIQYVKDWNEQVTFQVAYYENCINQYLDEIKQLKKKLFFMKQLYNNNASIHFKSLNFKESQQQSIYLSQYQQSVQKNVHSQFPKIPIYLTHQMVQEQANKQHFSNSKISFENQLAISEQHKSQQNPLIQPFSQQQQISAQQDQNTTINHIKLKQADSIQIDYTIQNNFIDAFNFFNHQQTEPDDLGINLHQVANDQKFKLLLALIGLVTLNIAFSRCDFFCLMLLFLTIPYQLKKWNAQQVNFLTLGIGISIIMDIYWLYKYSNCFSESYQCNNQFGFVQAIYFFCLFTMFGKLYVIYKIRSQQ